MTRYRIHIRQESTVIWEVESDLPESEIRRKLDEGGFDLDPTAQGPRTEIIEDEGVVRIEEIK
jgi:hypothetical protein